MNKTDKFAKIRKSLNLSKATELFIPMYSEELFISLGKGDRDDFYNLTCVEDIAYDYFQALEGTTLEKITFGVIDEDYLEYIKENSLEDNKLTQKNYVENLTDAERKESWVRNGYNYGYDFGILPFIFENKNFDQDLKKSDVANYNFVLSDKVRKAIKESIYKSFIEWNEDGVQYNLTEENIFISPYLVRLSSYQDDNVIDTLFEIGVGALNGDSIGGIEEYKRQNIDASDPLDFFGVLVLFRYEVPCTITRDYIEVAKNSSINVPDIDINTIEEIMTDEIDITHELLTVSLIYPNAIDDVIKEFVEIIARQSMKKIDTYDNKMNTMVGHFKPDKKRKKKK